ncbi:hypothetical protein ABW20_dc0100686 [Dactylellina cionopaga]|nr:hypothetical protein ABW20_dc0100686 [Dactylellina cionopaga]
MSGTRNYTHEPPLASTTETCALEDQLERLKLEKHEKQKHLEDVRNKPVPPLPNGRSNRGLQASLKPKAAEQPSRYLSSGDPSGSDFPRYNEPPNRAAGEPPAPSVGYNQRSEPYSSNGPATSMTPRFSPAAESEPYIPREPEAPAASDDSAECEICSKTLQNYLICNVCQIVFCKECWPDYLPHKSGRKNPIRGVRLQKHEPIDPIVEAKLDKILEPRVEEQEQEAMHGQDDDTAWFAVVKDESDDLVFQDLGRYGNIVSGLRKKCYPALVSFIGPTGTYKRRKECHSTSLV